nr:retrovirus-related Pol polyprotein from transposon TNT 1-94 [Tanacetum cinerariifolium]
MVDDKVDKVPSTSTLVDPTYSSCARPVLTNARLAVEVFDGTGHFGMWQSEVLDALFQQGPDIAAEESKPEDVEERNWLTINRLACGTIRSCLSREQRYAFSKETSAYKLWVALEEKFLKKNCQNKLFMKKRLFHFTYVPGTTMNDHITRFNQLLTNLMNMDEVFKDQDLALILLGSLPKEYELLETTLLNGKDDVSLTEVCAALYSKELRRNDKQISSSGDVEVLLVRGRSQKMGTGHWKRDCPRLKTKDNHYKGKAIVEANIIECDDKESELLLATSSSRNASEIWLLDSACSHHITPHREWFSNFVEHEEVVYTVDETSLTTHGIGSVRLQNEDGTIVTLKGVRYSPKLKKNLISVGTLESKGFKVRAKDRVMKIISGVLVVMKGIHNINNTYHYKGRTVIGTVAAVTDGDKNSEAVKLWHMRLGHAGEKSLNFLIKQGLIKGLSSCKLDLCEHCINGKTTRVKFGTTIHKTQGILDYVHSDKKMMETQTSRKIKHLRTDNGGEYKNDLFTKFSEDEGIARHFIVRHTPQQKVVAEHMNRTLLEKVRCMLSNAGLGKEFWAEVVTSAAYYHVKKSKLDPRAKKALFIGITSGIKGYRLWCPETKKTIFSRDVTFNESAMLKKVNVEQLDGTPKKVEFERIIVPANRETDDNSPMVEEDYEEEEDCLEKRNAVSLEESDMGVDQPPRREEGNWMQMAQLDLELVQMDVKTAFIHGDLEEEIYMVQPEGFKVAGKAHEVCKLYNSLCGLKQSRRQSYKLFDKFMMESKHTRSKYDHCVYLKKLQDGSFIYLRLYVDDMLIASQNLDEIEKLKIRLKSEFEMKDLGEAKTILGMEIVRDRKLRKLCLTQKQYLRRVLKQRAYMGKVPYANVVGSLMYAMICIRPDISHVVVMVRLVFEHGSSQWVAGYCDSDYARDLDKRRSTTCYVFTLAKAQISWKSTLQSTTTLSTTEAEYMAMTEAVKVAIWLQGLLGELGISQKFVTMHSDSQSAILSKESSLSRKDEAH